MHDVSNAPLRVQRRFNANSVLVNEPRKVTLVAEDLATSGETPGDSDMFLLLSLARLLLLLLLLLSAVIKPEVTMVTVLLQYNDGKIWCCYNGKIFCMVKRRYGYAPFQEE